MEDNPLRSLAVVSLLTVAALGSPPPGEAVDRATATFAGGCFWCMEGPFEALPGVFSVTSGYSGGQKKNPTYEEVSAGITGHAESVQVVYDPAKVTYDQLLETFWHNIDPVSANGQFCDRGTQYRSAIFYADEAQKAATLASKAKLEESGQLKKPIVTQIVAFSAFYPAEDYHQDFYKKNPFRYQTYRMGCGRDQRLKELWGATAGGHK